MTHSHDLLTSLRQQYLEAFRFCQGLADGMCYRPTTYRPEPEMREDAAEALHTLMGYRADQPEI